MKTKLLTFAVVLLVASFTLGSTQPPVPQWEYKFVNRCDEKNTNQAAVEGWELSAMSMTAYGSIGVATCVFKRPK